MTTRVKAGILIGVLCGIWTFIMGLTGWYKDPVMLNMFWVVVLIQFGVLIWGLRKTAAEKTYWGQVGTGTWMSVIGGAILFFVSFLFTTVAFPQYFEELRSMHTQILQSQGKTEAQIAAEVNAAAATQTPFLQAVFGFIGTVVTGFVASLIIGAFVRKKA